MGTTNSTENCTADSVEILILIVSSLDLNPVGNRRNHDGGQAHEIPVHVGGAAHAVPLEVPLQNRVGAQGVVDWNGSHGRRHGLRHGQAGRPQGDQVPPEGASLRGTDDTRSDVVDVIRLALAALPTLCIDAAVTTI